MRRLWLIAAVVGILAVGTVALRAAWERWQLAQANAETAYHRARALHATGEVEKAKTWMLRAAEQGHAAGQFEVGVYYQVHFHDHDQAFKWFRKAAERGNADAQLSIGMAYEFGREDVVANAHEALKWYGKAAAQDQPSALVFIGNVVRTRGRGARAQPPGSAGVVSAGRP